QRKKVAKTAAAAATDAAPKKRGRPAKAKEAAPEPKDDLIQGLVASAKKAAATPTSTTSELSEDEVTPVAVVAAAVAKPKLAAKPKAAVAKPKAPERKVIEMDGENFWVEEFSGEKVIVRCSDNYAFNLSGEGLGKWDDKTKTIVEDDEESSCDEE
ncbi:MAG: hypothetical protein EBR47_12815, partial [Betaproteobacteria bacterium]|nr:hypothetical protein [Betaproteobacteria bacterium]